MNVSQFTSARDEQVLSEYYSEKYRDKKPVNTTILTRGVVACSSRQASSAFTR